MVYVGCGLLNEVEEMHRKPEAVSCQGVQVVGRDVNLFLKNKWDRLPD
jgi:hypothetical protein